MNLLFDTEISQILTVKSGHVTDYNKSFLTRVNLAGQLRLGQHLNTKYFELLYERKRKDVRNQIDTFLIKYLQLRTIN